MPPRQLVDISYIMHYPDPAVPPEVNEHILVRTDGHGDFYGFGGGAYFRLPEGGYAINAEYGMPDSKTDAGTAEVERLRVDRCQHPRFCRVLGGALRLPGRDLLGAGVGAGLGYRLVG